MHSPLLSLLFEGLSCPVRCTHWRMGTARVVYYYYTCSSQGGHGQTKSPSARTGQPPNEHRPAAVDAPRLHRERHAGRHQML
jgi:hypothetical protein